MVALEVHGSAPDILLTESHPLHMMPKACTHTCTPLVHTNMHRQPGGEAPDGLATATAHNSTT